MYLGGPEVGTLGSSRLGSSYPDLGSVILVGDPRRSLDRVMMEDQPVLEDRLRCSGRDLGQSDSLLYSCAHVLLSLCLLGGREYLECTECSIVYYTTGDGEGR